MQPPGWGKRLLSLPRDEASGISDAYSPPQGKSGRLGAGSGVRPCGGAVPAKAAAQATPYRQPGLEGSAGCQSSWAVALIPRKLLVWE